MIVILVGFQEWNQSVNDHRRTEQVGLGQETVKMWKKGQVGWKTKKLRLWIPTLGIGRASFLEESTTHFDSFIPTILFRFTWYRCALQALEIRGDTLGMDEGEVT